MYKKSEMLSSAKAEPMYPLKHITLATLLALTALGVSSAASAQEWVAVTNNGSGLNGAAASTGTVVTVNGTTGQGALRTVYNRPGFALAWSPADGNAYAVRGMGGGRQELIEINPSTLGFVRSVGVLADSVDPSFMHAVSALGVAANGTLYGISVRRELIGGFKVPVGVLVAIDTKTAVSTQVGGLGLAVYSRGGTVLGDSFYVLTSTNTVDREFRLYSIGLADAATSLVGNTGIAGFSAGLSADDQGRLLAVMDGAAANGPAAATLAPRSRLYEINTRTAGATLIGDTSFDCLSGFSWMVRPPSCGAVSGGPLDITGNGFVDAYSCSTLGAISNGATLCSNGDIRIASSGIVQGDVVAAGTVTTTNSNNVTGSIIGQAATNALPTVDTTAAQASNNNANIPLTDKGRQALSGTTLTVRSGDSLTLLPGTYYLTSLNLSGTARLNIVGQVTIVLTGELELNNSSSINALGSAADFTLQTTATEVEFEGSASFTGTLIAPNADVQIKDSSSFSGLVVGDSVQVQNFAQLHLADCLAGTMP